MNNNLEYKDKYEHQDFTNALYHVLSCIDSRGLDKCTHDTQVSYDILKSLVHKLDTDTVLYRP